MTEKARTRGRPKHALGYLDEVYVSPSISRRRVHRRTFLVGIEYISICVSQSKLIGDWWCLPSPFLIH